MSSLNKFFAKGNEHLSSILQSAREGNLCLKIPNGPSIAEGIVKDQDRYYLQKDWVYETHIVEHVKRLQKIQVEISGEVLDRIEKDEKLSIEQREVASHLYKHAFSILCGGPGTGKTHTAACFVKHFTSGKVIVSAPTGKAAIHLQSKIGSHCEAMTLHRLLRLKPCETRLFSKRRIDADLVIVDEASMIDVTLFAHLLEAVGDQTRLILMGDPNQLPPIDAGSVFSSLSELFGIHLKTCMRTEDAHLQQAAQAILSGDEEKFFATVQRSEDFDLIYDRIKPVISPQKIDPPKMHLACLNALRQGPYGLEALNRKILEKMDQQCPDSWWWTIPIIVSANLPSLNLYNGSTGFLIGQKDKKINLTSGTAYFPEIGELKNIPPFELAFVISIHKSQGSEYDEVIALFPEGSETFGKEALYTAATRAKKRWEIIGKKEIFCQMLSKKSFRLSGLKERLFDSVPTIASF
ncbi:MAG TPA: AAA family ATPase [Chlamydiales bacterium]|nr:AAA family ATPase [Chlamydiales bacterium]